MTNPQDHQFRHQLRWPLLHRQGQSCQILRSFAHKVHIRFEDGYEATTDRRALTRRKELDHGEN